MNNSLFNLNYIRTEISFKSFDELRKILSFHSANNLFKINIPCKNTLKKDFLLNSIKIAREEFPSVDIIPHFSILHEFKKNRLNTQDSLVDFLRCVKNLGCRNVLLVSGSQQRATLDSVKALSFLKGQRLFYKQDLSMGVAFNPYLPNCLFEEEVIRLERKLQSGLVSSVWIQFGTDCKLLKSRMEILLKIISSTTNKNPKISHIMIFGSILIPTKQFLARFKYRPWKGVYCSNDFLESVEVANNLIIELLKTYKHYKICPIIETCVSTKENLRILKNILTYE